MRPAANLSPPCVVFGHFDTDRIHGCRLVLVESIAGSRARIRVFGRARACIIAASQLEGAEIQDVDVDAIRERFLGGGAPS